MALEVVPELEKTVVDEIDLTTALARLLSNPGLRADFHRNRQQTIEGLGVRAIDRPALLALDVCALEAQSQTLIDKRCKEVARLAPLTWKRLGPDRAKSLFGEFAVTHWPTGHRRHVDDALAFIGYLETLSNSEICRDERNRLRFAAGRRRLAVHLVAGISIGNCRKRGIQILYRRAGVPKQLALFLRFQI